MSRKVLQTKNSLIFAQNYKWNGKKTFNTDNQR